MELGLIGLSYFTGLIIYGLYKNIQLTKNKIPLVSLLGFVGLAAWLIIIIHGLVDVPYFKNDLAVLFWLIVSLPLLDNPRPRSVHGDVESGL